MIMIKESDLHRQMAAYVARIGREPIMIENKDNESFKRFKEKKKESGKDSSSSMFKHENETRGLPI